MDDVSRIRISDLVSAAAAVESLEACSALVGARVFVLDGGGEVVAMSEAKGCSCGTCAHPPRRIGGDMPARAEVRALGATIGSVCACRGDERARVAVAWLARGLTEKATDQVDLDSLSGELLHQYEEVHLVYDISQAISSVFDEKRIAELVLERAMKATRARRSMAVLADKESGDFRVAASIGVPPEATASPSVLLDRGICGQTVQTGKAVVVDAHDGAGPEEGPFSPPLACSPLIANGAVIGVVALAGKEGGGNFTSGNLKLLTAISSQMGIAIHNARLIQETKKQERLRRELEIAASIQTSLLPHSPPRLRDVEIAARSVTAERVGGDYYGFFDGANGGFSLVIADVSGHSVAAALMAATLRSVARAAKAHGGSAAEVVGRINRMIYEDLANARMLVSMFYAEYDGASSAISLANAGHNRPVLCRGGESSIVEVPGLILGVSPEQNFPEKVLPFRPGDVVVFYTDGLVESEGPSHEPYGEERLKETVSRNSSRPLRDLLDVCLEDVCRHAGKRSLYDDVTMVAVRRR